MHNISDRMPSRNKKYMSKNALGAKFSCYLPHIENPLHKQCIFHNPIYLLYLSPLSRLYVQWMLRKLFSHRNAMAAVLYKGLIYSMTIIVSGIFYTVSHYPFLLPNIFLSLSSSLYPLLLLLSSFPSLLSGPRKSVTKGIASSDIYSSRDTLGSDLKPKMFSPILKLRTLSGYSNLNSTLIPCGPGHRRDQIYPHIRILVAWTCAGLG